MNPEMKSLSLKGLLIAACSAAILRAAIIAPAGSAAAPVG